MSWPLCPAHFCRRPYIIDRTTDALFLIRWLQNEHRGKDERMYRCFVDLDKAFDTVSRRVMEGAMRKKGLPKILVNAVKSLCKGEETKTRVGSGLSENFFCESWCTPSICVFAIVVCNGDR